MSAEKTPTGEPQPQQAQPVQPAAKAAPATAAQEPDKAKEYFEQLLRLKADFENFRKRVDRERPELLGFGRAQVLLKLLPVYDLLRRAHEQILKTHAQTEFAKGMEMIFKEFEKIFKEEGVRPMEPAGKPYDARAHEVLGTVEKDDAEEGSVVEVLQDGFMLQDKVLRPAKVRIARRPQAPEASEKEKSDS